MITQQFDLNLIPSQAPVIVNVDQYDTGTGRLVISLYADDEPYTPSNASAVIQGIKPDRHGFSHLATLSGNTVTANLTDQMTPVAGDVRTQIVVTEPSGRTGTFAFILRVQKSALPDDTDLSESDYSLLEEAIDASLTAVSAAASASASETAAAASERAAATSETNAIAADRSATAAASAASASATNAAASESASATSSGNAVTSAANALASERAAKQSEQNAKASEDILSFYADFVTPRFIIQNNRLYINDPSLGDFVVANNRLYFKIAS